MSVTRETVELVLEEVLVDYPLPTPAPKSQVFLTAATVASRIVGAKKDGWWEVRSTALSILGSRGGRKQTQTKKEVL